MRRRRAPATPSVTRSSAEAPRPRPGLAWRGFAFAPARSTTAAATSSSSSSGTPSSRRRVKPEARASSSTRAAGSSTPSASPKRPIASAATGSLKRSAGGRRERVRRAVGDPVATAERLSHRVTERQPRGAERGAGVLGAFEQPGASFEVLAVGEHLRQRLVDQLRARERLAIALGVVTGHVERLGTVRQRVQRRPAALVARQVERQPRLVDDSGEVRSGAAALHPAAGVADAEESRPLGARVGRRHRDERQAGLGGDGLGQVDRAAAADGEQAVSAPAAAVATSAMRSVGTSVQRPMPGSGSSVQRSLATTNGRSIASSASSPSSSSRPQRTITDALARTPETPPRHASASGRRSARARSGATGRAPSRGPAPACPPPGRRRSPRAR